MCLLQAAPPLSRRLAHTRLTILQRDVNFAVRKTIDRLIFLRICEDRWMETYGVNSKPRQADGSHVEAMRPPAPCQLINFRCCWAVPLDCRG
ncbi:MAG: hypothetical protein EA424_03850 [Planctomycetaceae bacterium]|nr:MAG: hypothetical protein EA424_03850 [Planctomycetaceae bacterium]